MSDLKPCPFCGSKSWEFRILDCEDREGTPCAYFCEACGAQSPWVYCRKSGEDINTMDDHKLIAMLCSRPIEDALRAEIANLKLECESWREGAERDRAEIAELSNGVMVASERAGRYAEEIAALRDKYERQPEEVTP